MEYAAQFENLLIGEDSSPLRYLDCIVILGHLSFSSTQRC
jgi:hypothetical protein